MSTHDELQAEAHAALDRYIAEHFEAWWKRFEQLGLAEPTGGTPTGGGRG